MIFLPRPETIIFGVLNIAREDQKTGMPSNAVNIGKVEQITISLCKSAVAQ